MSGTDDATDENLIAAYRNELSGNISLNNCSVVVPSIPIDSQNHGRCRHRFTC
jgi:hypothetical protein